MADSTSNSFSIITEDDGNKAIQFDIKDTGSANEESDDWTIQLIQTLKLEKGKTYKFSYDAKSTLPRKIHAKIQSDGENGGDWSNYPGTNPVELTSSWQTFESEEFTMSRTDNIAKLSICLGNFGPAITTQHQVLLDNIKVEEVESAPVVEENVKVTVSAIDNQVYTGSAIKPEPEVKIGEKVLEKDKDYKLTYKNNVNPNKNGLFAGDTYNKYLPTVTITGIGNFESVITMNFNINKADIAEVATINAEDYTLAGKAVAYTVTRDGKKLTSKDYTGKVFAKDAVDKDDNAIVSTNALKKIPSGASGTFEIKITAKGNYTGTLTKVVTVDKKLKPLNQASVKMNVIAATENVISANDIKNAIKEVKVDGKKLAEDDYTVFWVEKVGNSGEYEAELMPVEGKTVRSKTIKVVIKGKSIKTTKISFDKDPVYDGTAKGNNGLKVQVKSGRTYVDVPAENYDVEVAEDDTNAGKVKVTIKGKGLYEGTVIKTYTIKPYELKLNVNGVSVNDIADQKYIGKNIAVVPGADEVVVKWGENDLEAGKDYKVSYSNNKAIANNKATIKITGKGNYKGTLSKKFNIVAGDFSEAQVDVKDVVASTKANKYQSKVTVTIDGKKLTAGTDYNKKVEYYQIFRKTNGTIASEKLLDKYSKPVAGSEIKAVVTCTDKYTGDAKTAEAVYRIVTADISKATVKIAKKAIALNADPIELTDDDFTQVTLKVGKVTKKLELGKDYEIVGYENNNKAGTAKVTIKGIGNYGGTKTVKFTITKIKIVK